jgi:hypothetical protein
MNAIQIKTPTVKTTTVSVKNVMIGKRQLTQRVFNQIINEDIFDVEKPETLKGDAWGFVNYQQGGYHNLNDYKHILWVNKKGELRKCYVEKIHPQYCNPWEGSTHEQAATYLVTKLPQLFIAV